MKSYISLHLNSNEELLREARMHIFALLPALVWMIMVLIFLTKMTIFDTRFPDYQAELKAVKIFILLLAAYFFYLGAKDIIIYFSTELGFTDKRLLGKVGLFKIRSIVTPLNKINHISISQGFFGRIFGYGNILIFTSSGQITYQNIAHNLEFINSLTEQIERLIETSEETEKDEKALARRTVDSPRDLPLRRSEPAYPRVGPVIPREKSSSAPLTPSKPVAKTLSPPKTPERPVPSAEKPKPVPDSSLPVTDKS
ncbi:MAG: PH domain-containing protein [Deltaproteobacteria bacterium]|jgi:membrane protein YdbS with pleckstrin-like domain|nr:PH domain-containing protein [Deltaproteobacteria bacterium]